MKLYTVGTIIGNCIDWVLHNWYKLIMLSAVIYFVMQIVRIADRFDLFTHFIYNYLTKANIVQ